MAKKLMWCPNCKQNVSPQKEKGNKGSVFLGLMLLGFVLLFFGVIPGLIVFGIAFLYLVAGILYEILMLAKKAKCPICKASNLVNNLGLKARALEKP